MKYFSEKLDKMFDTQSELIKAEKEACKKEAELQKVEDSTEVQKVNEKKELAKEIEIKEQDLDDAYKTFELCRKDANKILSDANKQAAEIMSHAREVVKKAQEERYMAVAKFNEKFGAYTRSYTGTDARREYLRALERFNSIVFDTFRNWF